jgi:hypothetical protein
MDMASTQPTSPTAEPVVGIARAEARRLGSFYLLMVVGDALYVSDMELCTSEGKPLWRMTVSHKGTRERMGELHMDAQTGEGVRWYPDAESESNEHKDGA